MLKYGGDAANPRKGMVIYMNENKLSVLAELPVKALATVRHLNDGGHNISERLENLGFKEGAEVECVGKSPLGGMRAYRVMGTVIALRDEDAALVITSHGSRS